MNHFVCTAKTFSLPSSLVSKQVMPAFGQGKFVCVYGRQRKLDKLVQEILLGFWQRNGGLDAR
jgi:hypothetical protein